MRRSSYLQILALLAVVAIGLLAARPLFDPRLHHGYDTLTHFYKQVQLDHLVRNGILYTRWFPHKYSGFGAPLFQYYAPLAYYAAQIFSLLGLELLPAMRLAYGLAVVGAGLGCYLWVRDAFGVGPAIVAAAAYLGGPYLLYNAYTRGSFTEQYGLLFIPWVLWAFRRLAVSGKIGYLVTGAVAYAGLLLSHNLTALIFSPALAAYTLALALGSSSSSAGKGWIRVWFKQLLAIGLGLGLSAFFWLPAFLERRALRSDLAYVNPSLDFHNHFVSVNKLLVPPWSASIRPALSLVALILVLVAAGFLLARRPAKDAEDPGFQALQRWEVGVALLVLAGCVLLVLPVSVAIWEALPPLRLFQFPFRFLAVAGVFLAFLTGAGSCCIARWLGQWPENPVWKEWLPLLFMAVAVGLLLTQGRGLVGVRYFPPLPEIDVNFVMQKEREVAPVIGQFTGVYIPAGVESPPPLENQALDGPQRLDQNSLPDGAQLVAADYGLLHYDLTFASPEPFTAVFRTFNFPGWKAEIDGQPVPITATRPHGQISVPVPAGEHQLRVWFGSTPTRTAATVLSMVSLLALVLLAIGAGWLAR